MFNLDHHDQRHHDILQVILGVGLDQRGRPACLEIWPGKTLDAKATMPIIGWTVFNRESPDGPPSC